MLYCCTLVSHWVLQLPTLTTILNDCLLIFIKCFTYLYSPQYLELILYINCEFVPSHFNFFKSFSTDIVLLRAYNINIYVIYGKS